MDKQYTSVSQGVIEQLWPEKESRPKAAWECWACQLIVTDRARHNDNCSEGFGPVFLPIEKRREE